MTAAPRPSPALRSESTTAYSMGAVEPDPRRWAALLVVVAAMFMALVDVFIVNVAAPVLQRQLPATDSQLELIVGGYTLVYGLLLVTGGRIGDRWGRKRTFLAGVSAFTAASAACGLAPNPELLIGFRAVEGIGAALMVPQVFSIIQVTFPPAERQKALGVYGGAVGLATTVSQVLGGVLIALDLFGSSWRAVFFVNVPIGIAAIVAGRFLLRESRSPERSRFDLAGVVLLTAALVLLTYPLITAPSAGWTLSTLVQFALAALAGAAFLVVERRRERNRRGPLLPPSLFAAPAFRAGLLVLFLAQSTQTGFLFAYALNMQSGLGYSALAVGATLMAPGLGYAVASLQANRISKILGPRIVAVGSAGLFVGYAAFAGIAALEGRHLGLLSVVVPALVIGLAMGLVFTPAINVVLARVRPELVGAGSGVVTTVIQVANLVGIAGGGTLFFVFRAQGSEALPVRSAASFALTAGVVAALQLGALAAALRLSRASRSLVGAARVEVEANVSA